MQTRGMVEQLTVIDPGTRWGDVAMRLDAAELGESDAVLLLTLGLD